MPDQLPDQLPDQMPDQLPDQMPDQGFAQQPAFPPPEDRPAGRRRPEPRMVSLAVGLGVTLAAGAVLFSLPVPYLVETPGPTVDTLGSQDGKELIQIDQEPTHQVTGQLRLTTVGAIGSNPGSLDLFNLVEGYFDGDDAVVPYDLIYPRHTTAEEREAQSAAEMTSSQDAAVAAALEHLGMPVGVEVVEPQTAAAKAVFAAGDELTSINGQPINGFASLKAILGGIEAGGPVEVGLIRDGRAESVTAETSPDGEGGALLGVTVTFKSPVKIEFGVEDIGGPSAGSMFALGIIAKLGPSDLAGGRVIAGTGTVDAEGVIGGIGGIRQKMIGAKRDGAEVFLAPAANCAEVVGNEPPGLQVVKVASLDDAVDALDALRAGSQADLPVCSQADAG
ncbi:MAG: PDZ domain-containing protein [Bifidobacteriaceae bacterium]|jgi:PDZ domain-containing protein|nr:PDZ domain-containing protein [Bifidobacteriaceae bacterium]